MIVALTWVKATGATIAYGSKVETACRVSDVAAPR